MNTVNVATVIGHYKCSLINKDLESYFDVNLTYSYLSSSLVLVHMVVIFLSFLIVFYCYS